MNESANTLIYFLVLSIFVGCAAWVIFKLAIWFDDFTERGFK